MIFYISQYIFLFVDNQEYFGHLVNPDTYNFSHLRNDMWQIFENPVVRKVLKLVEISEDLTQTNLEVSISKISVV